MLLRRSAAHRHAAIVGQLTWFGPATYSRVSRFASTEEEEEAPWQPFRPTASRSTRPARAVTSTRMRKIPAEAEEHVAEHGDVVRALEELKAEIAKMEDSQE